MINKISNSIHFWELKTQDGEKRYGYIFRKTETGKWVIKSIKKCPYNIKSIYVEETRTYYSLKECKRYLKEWKN